MGLDGICLIVALFEQFPPFSSNHSDPKVVFIYSLFISHPIVHEKLRANYCADHIIYATLHSHMMYVWLGIVWNVPIVWRGDMDHLATLLQILLFNFE